MTTIDPDIKKVIECRKAEREAFAAWQKRMEELADDIDPARDNPTIALSLRHSIAQIEYSRAVYSLFPLSMEQCAETNLEELKSRLEAIEPHNPESCRDPACKCFPF